MKMVKVVPLSGFAPFGQLIALGELIREPLGVLTRAHVAPHDAERHRANEAADRQRLLTATPPGYSKVWTASDTTAVRFALAMRALALVEQRCIHISWPPLATHQTFVSLATRSATCRRAPCIAAAVMYWRDDGLCEGCDRKTDVFVTSIVPTGGMMLTIELCEPCNALMHVGVA